MWKDTLPGFLKRNVRLILGSLSVFILVEALLLLGYLTNGEPTLQGLALQASENIGLALVLGAITMLLFGFWTVQSNPRYPQTPLEHHQEAVEREIASEWGNAIAYLRLAVSRSEECGNTLLEAYRTGLQQSHEPELMQTILLGMHAKACDLARVVADLSQRGHSEAAFVLWRSIFELQINMQFIAQEGNNDRAERFQDWSIATHLRLHDATSDELKALRLKYAKPWQLDKDMGWTRANSPMGIPTRAKEIGYPTERDGKKVPVLELYADSNAYVHNDATGIFIDLGSNRAFDRGPSLAGHDMPLCLTAYSLSTITETLVVNQNHVELTELAEYVDSVYIARNAVELEVAMVPDRLLSQYKGIDKSIDLPAGDGKRLVVIPARRDRTVKEIKSQRRKKLLSLLKWTLLVVNATLLLYLIGQRLGLW